MISSFPGGSVLTSRSVSASCISASVGDVVCSKLYWSVPSIVRLARLLSWVVAPACPWSERFCLLCTCHTPAGWSCRLYLALPCLLHLLPGLQGRLCGSACLFLSSSYVWFASLYCSLCLSLSRSDLASKTFFLRALPFSVAFQLSSVIHSFIFLSFVPRQALQVCS